MPWTALLTTVRAEIAAAERRTIARARAVEALLAAGSDRAAAEQVLFRELDGLALLRARLRTLEEMRDRLAGY